MADTPIIGPAGLQLSNNDFNASPPGSLRVADNIVISQKGVAEPRNGQDKASTLVGANAQLLAWALTEFQGDVIASCADVSNAVNYGLGPVAGGTITGFSSFGGVFNPVDADGSRNDVRLRFAQAAQFLHFCTTDGPKALEDIAGQPRVAGLPRMPDPDVSVIASAQAWMPYNSSVAYRVVLVRPTSTGVSLIGPPSNRIIATNRLLIAAGGLVRTGGNSVTATRLVSAPTVEGFQGVAATTTFVLAPGEADFPAAGPTAGKYVVGSLAGPTLNQIIFPSAGANVPSTLAQDLDSGPKSVEIVAPLPAAAAIGDSVRVYRSVATSLSTVQPSDDLYLCAEVFLDATAIANGFIDIDDNTPQSVISNPLYTNPTTGQGADQINFQPPIYRDVTNWDGQTWYLNTTGQHSLRMEMLGIGAPDGIQEDDTITITDAAGSTTFTFEAAPTGPNDMLLVSDGLPSYNIRGTSNYLTEFSAPITSPLGYVIYQNSGVNDFPGKLLIERTDHGGPFTVVVSRPASWAPAFGPSGVVSTNNRQPNGLSNSKPAQPEAVPAVNFRNVGSKSYNGDRILGLRNALLIFKEGDGIWSLTGSAPYNLQQISTANIIAPSCCAVFADSAWVYTDQGILRISDTGGAQVVSRPIETELNRLAALFPQDTFDYAFAVPYETERRIMFYVPVGTQADRVGIAIEAWCYSLATNAWTRFNAQATSGLVTTAHRLWLGQYSNITAAGILSEERKGNTPDYLDKSDELWSNTITATSVNGNPLLIKLGTTGSLDGRVVVGRGFGIGQGLFLSKIAAHRTDISADCYEVSEVVPWNVAACYMWTPYRVEIQFLPTGEPTTRKTLTRLSTFYKPGSNNRGTEAFSNYFGVTTIFTDQIQAEAEIPTPFLGFGLTPFGQGPFGNPSPMVVDTNPIGPQWTNAAQFYPGFVLDEVWVGFKLQGVALHLATATGPVGRGP